MRFTITPIKPLTRQEEEERKRKIDEDYWFNKQESEHLNSNK